MPANASAPGDPGRLVDPVCFVQAGRPMTANKSKGRSGRKIAELKALYLEAGGTRSDRFRYGIVYYFVRDYCVSTDSDADNVSKPIWDALEGEAYEDDKVIRLRKAGVIEIGAANDAPALEIIDLTDMPDAAANRFLELVESREKHIVYVELGWVRPDMYTFNLAGREGRT